MIKFEYGFSKRNIYQLLRFDIVITIVEKLFQWMLSSIVSWKDKFNYDIHLIKIDGNHWHLFSLSCHRNQFSAIAKSFYRFQQNLNHKFNFPNTIIICHFKFCRYSVIESSTFTYIYNYLIRLFIHAYFFFVFRFR